VENRPFFDFWLLSCPGRLTAVCLTFSAFLICGVFFPSSSGFGQDFGFGDPDSWIVNASNQMEYSSDGNTGQDIFHNWTDLDLTYGDLRLNLRYEAHQPDDWGDSWQGFTFRNAQMSSEFLEVTAGNYYVLFGRGLILRSYENRDLRFDNNIDGARGIIEFEGFKLTMLTGNATDRYKRLEDPLHAADAKVALTDWSTLGGSYLRTHITDFGLVRMYGGNVGISLPNVDLYAEYAEKNNPSGEYIPDDGSGIYASANVYTSGLGLSLEFKDYDKLSFTNGDVVFNNPPSLAREHAYTLLNRHAYILDMYDERGYQAEITSSPFEDLSVLVNGSYTTNRKDDLVFSEIYSEAEYDWEYKATIKGGFSRQEYKTELGSPVRLAPVVDIVYYLSEATTLDFILEHLYTEKYDAQLTYYDQILSLSLSQSPVASLTLTYERTTEWETAEQWTGRKDWLMGYLDLALGDDHNLSLGLGTRREGKVCSGGVCVDKPALDGWEIKLLSRF
jgi:hypothetical protein